MESQLRCLPLHCAYFRFVIPQRYMLMGMLHLATFNAYHLRMVLQAVSEELSPAKNLTDFEDVCPEAYERSPMAAHEPAAWVDKVQSYSGYVFYLCFAAGHVPGGWLADKYGARHVLGASILISAIVVMLLPVSLEYEDHRIIGSLRAVFGFAQAFLFPSISSFLQHWVAPPERAVFGGIAFGGGSLGIVFACMLTGPIMRATGRWDMPFYVWGCVAILWYIFYIFMAFSKPSTHPFIGKSEVELMQKIMAPKTPFSIPWNRIIMSTPVWALLVLNFGGEYMASTLLMYFPEFMRNMLKWHMRSNEVVSTLPYFFMWLVNYPKSIFGGWVVSRKYCTLLVFKKTYGVIGNLVTAIFLLVAAHLKCHRITALILYSIAMSLRAAILSSVLLIPNDLSIHFAGTIMGITNGIPATTGILGRWVVNYLTRKGLLEEWQNVFFVILGVCFVTSTIFVFFADVKRQPWDYPPKDDDSIDL